MHQWLDYISTISVLIPLLASIYRYKRLNTELKLLSWLFIFASIVELINFISVRNHISNFWIVNIYSLIEGFVIFYIISKWINVQNMLKVTLILFVIYCLYWLYTTFFISSIFDFNSKEKTVKGLMLIFLSGYLLIRLSIDEKIVLYKDYRFWISCDVMIYFSITLIVFSTATVFLEDNHRAAYYSWMIHSIINTISNLIFAYSYTWYYRKTNSFT